MPAAKTFQAPRTKLAQESGRHPAFLAEEREDAMTTGAGSIYAERLWSAGITARS